MIFREQTISVLRQYNPWWTNQPLADIPSWHRAAFSEIYSWAQKPPAGRALLLAGARQIGKTTLFLQAIQRLLEGGVRPANILYVTFDHPLLKLAGIEEVLTLWREMEPLEDGPEYLFLDEVHNAEHWQTIIKQQVDFHKNRRIAMTGSATPLVREGQESGVGRWYTIQLATLSFFEYLKIKGLATPKLPDVPSMAALFNWKPSVLARVAADAAPLTIHFQEYLLRGGFPQCALVETVEQAQRLLREDIVDKVLKRDMTALFGVRRVLALERLFLFLCMNDGTILDINALASELRVPRQTVEHYLDVLESAHLIYRLLPYGYGKEVMRGRSKAYLADAAIAPAVMLKGKSLLTDGPTLGRAVETAVFKHIYARYYRQNMRCSYWRNKHGDEVDIIAEIEGQRVAFEVKYRSSIHASDFKGLRAFTRKHQPSRAYIVTRSLSEFGVAQDTTDVSILKIPALLMCYWLSKSELGDRISG